MESFIEKLPTALFLFTAAVIFYGLLYIFILIGRHIFVSTWHAAKRGSLVSEWTATKLRSFFKNN